METRTMPKLKSEAECTGCGACIAICSQKAISKKRVGFGAWVPEINADVCVKCGRCESVCKAQIKKHTAVKKAYIAYNRDAEMRQKSASGGVFSALATYVLDNGGSVFGAEMRFEDGGAVVEHSMVTQVKELPRLLGSKYVQSDCVKVYREVKKELQAGKMVLFSGCSCQITGLKNYLGDVDQTNLYTIDLICHGVPGIDFLNEYVQFLEKHGGKISRLSFRTKEKDRIVYRIDILVEESNKDMREIKIPMRESGYFRMFMGEESYREACYRCQYASLEKPADITMGDYFEAKDDYPELFIGDDAIDNIGGISCLITHTDKGQELIQKAMEYLYLKEVEPKKVQTSHGNLLRPSKYTKLRGKLYKQYCTKGYDAIERYYSRRNAIVAIPRTVINLLRCHKEK